MGADERRTKKGTTPGSTFTFYVLKSLCHCNSESYYFAYYKGMFFSESVLARNREHGIAIALRFCSSHFWAAAMMGESSRSESVAGFYSGMSTLEKGKGRFCVYLECLQKQRQEGGILRFFLLFRPILLHLDYVIISILLREKAGNTQPITRFSSFHAREAQSSGGPETMRACGFVGDSDTGLRRRMPRARYCKRLGLTTVPSSVPCLLHDEGVCFQLTA